MTTFAVLLPVASVKSYQWSLLPYTNLTNLSSFQSEKTTRIHSSRMCTVRSSGRISGRVCVCVCGWVGGYLVWEGWGGLPGPGVYLVPGRHLVPGGVHLAPGGRGVPGLGVYLVLGGVPGWGVYLVRGCVPGPRGCTLSWGGVPGLGGCTWSWGVYLVPGGCTWSQEGVPGPGGVPGPRRDAWSGTPPCGQTHTCKNITFATSLRTVKMFTIPCRMNKRYIIRICKTA